MAAALDIHHEDREVTHPQLAGPGPEPGGHLTGRRERAQPGSRFRAAGDRAPDQELVAVPADKVLAPVPGDREKGLVDIDDQPVLQPDDDDGVRALLKKLR